MECKAVSSELLGVGSRVELLLCVEREGNYKIIKLELFSLSLTILT